VTEKGLIGFAAERSEGVRAVVAAKVMGPFGELNRKQKRVMGIE
jgi:hypothetical protein